MSYAEKDIRLIYRHTHPDYRGKINGVHNILINRGGGTCLVNIKDLMPAEFANQLEYAKRREARGERPY